MDELKENQWLPPSPILGAVHMITPILGPVFPIPPLDELRTTEDGEIRTTEGGEVREIENL